MAFSFSLHMQRFRVGINLKCFVWRGGCTVSHFQTHSVYYCLYHHASHGILHNPRGSRFVTATQHIPIPPSVLAQTHAGCKCPHRECWRCVSLPECNLAGPLSLVSSVTLCSHSIRAPRLRGAADKILIILAHRIKGTRTEGAHTHKHTHTLILAKSHMRVQ